MDVRVGLWRKLSAEELMLLNCGVGEYSWESLGLQGDPTSPFWRRSALGVLWREWCWSWGSSTLATSCEELTHWRRLWCWEGLAAGETGDNRGWDGWMASPTRWTWVWVNSGSWWWTGRPDVLRFTGFRGVGPDWATELNWTELMKIKTVWCVNCWLWTFFLNLLFLIGGWLLYSVVLVSAIDQHESAIGIHVSPPSWTSLPPPTLSHPSSHRALDLNSLHHTENSPWLSILHMVMYMFQCYSLNLSHLPLLCLQVCTLCLRLIAALQIASSVPSF